MPNWTPLAIALLASGPAWGHGVTFRVVDADSGQGLPGVRVQCSSFHMKSFFPFILPMCSYGEVCRGPELQTDSAGIVECAAVDGDDSISFQKVGYISVRASKGWSGWRISEYASENKSGTKLASVTFTHLGKDPKETAILVSMRRNPGSAALELITNESYAIPERLIQVTAAPGLMPWPKDWSIHLGQQITVEGMAINQKVGAALWGTGEAVFIDGIDSWPDGFYLGGERGKRLRVTGTVIERHDLPVFIPRKGALPLAGIPVPEGTDLHRASLRFLLQNAKWTAAE